MIRETSKKGAIALGILPLVFVALCRPVHFAGSVSGRAYDIDTGEGLEGAIVVAVWTVRGLENAYVSTLAIDETETDANGNFTIPGWGPKVVKPSIWAGRDPDAPQLYIFKSGYRPTTVANAGNGPPIFIGGPLRLSGDVNQRMLDELDLPVERFHGTLEEYIKPLSNMVLFRLRALYERDRCYWKRVPKLVLALDNEAKIATHRGTYARTLSMYNRPRSRCGSPAAFFNVPDDGLDPCESLEACVEAVERYDGPPDVFWLAVTPSAGFRPGAPSDRIVQALARRGWETDGYEMRDGYDVYRAKTFANAPDTNLNPCNSPEACVEAVERYNGPPDVYWLAVTPASGFKSGDSSNPIVKALAKRGWETDGYRMRIGYDVYRAKVKATP